MKKKFLTGMLVLLLSLSFLPAQKLEATMVNQAFSVDGSLLTNSLEEEGYSKDSLMRGYYLQSGYSRILKAGAGMITAGGNTTANVEVSIIKLSVKVERLVNGSWQSYTSWSVSDTDAHQITSSKTFSVPTGYYYRVKCVHSAESDGSSSFTNGIYIG